MAFSLDKAIELIRKIVLAIGSLGVLVMIYFVILGVLSGSLRSGSITNMDTVFESALNNTSGQIVSWLTNSTGVVTTVVGLIALVVILAVFGKWLKPQNKNKGSAF